MAGKSGQRLTNRQHLALAALLLNDTVEGAAAACGVPARTIRHWRRSCPAFNEALERAARDTWSHALARLKELSSKAVTTLSRNMDAVALAGDPRARAVEVRAALGLLQHLHDSELLAIKDTLAAAEEARKGGGGR